MSHVDDGALHAYLDGEMPPVERARVDEHLQGCAPCRARLDEERALTAHASRLLALASPAERPAPAWSAITRPRRVHRWRVPLAWAATLVIAVGAGWLARGAWIVRPPMVSSVTDRVTAPPIAAAAPRHQAGPLDSATRLKASVAGAGAPVAPANVAMAKATAAPAFTLDSARGALDAAPLLLPNRPIVGLYRDATNPGAVIVEQRLDDGAVVQLVEQRPAAAREEPRAEAQQAAPAPAAAPSADVLERRIAAPVQRQVGSLLIEIRGGLPADSLRKLLALVH